MKIRRVCAIMLASAMVITSALLPADDSMAAKKKAKISVNKTKCSLSVGKKAVLKVTTKNVKKIKSVKAVSSKKSYVKVTKVKKNKKSAQITVKAMKAKKADIKITVKYVPAGSSKAKTKKLTVKVTGTKKGVPVTSDKPAVTPASPDVSVPTETPTEAPTAVPTEAPTAVPTETPTETPTAVPTETPTPTPVPKVNITGVAIETNNMSHLRISFSEEVNLNKKDFSVKKKAFGSSEEEDCIVSAVNKSASKEYVVTLSDYLSYGDEVTVSISSLTGDVKAKSIVVKSEYDGTTQEYDVSGMNTGFFFSLDKAPYHLLGNVSIMNEEQWPEWLAVDDLENGLFSVREVSAGTYQVPVILMDELGVSVTVQINFTIGSEDKICLGESDVTKKISLLNNQLWQMEINNIMGGPEVESGSKYVVSAERTSGGTTEQLQWEISETNKIQVTGLVDVDQSWAVTVKSAKDEEIAASCTVSFEIISPVKISGTVLNESGAPVEEATICFRNLESDFEEVAGVESTTWVEEDGSYQEYLYPGVYKVSAYIVVGGMKYYAERENVTVEEKSASIPDINFIFNIETYNVQFTKSADSTVTIPEGWDFASFRDWYDETGVYFGDGNDIKLFPGSYTLYCPKVYMRSDEDDSWYLASATATFTVTDKDITVDAVVEDYEPALYQELSLDGSRVEVDLDECKRTAFGFTVEQEGYYTFKIVDNNDSDYSITTWLYDENFKYITSTGESRGLTRKLKPGKYFIEGPTVYETRDGSFVRLEKLESVRVSGKIKNENGEAISFGEDKLPMIYSYMGEEKITGTVNEDGSYSIEALQNSLFSVFFEAQSGLDGANIFISVQTGTSDVTDADFTLCQIRVQPDSAYQTGYRCTFHTWYSEYSSVEGEGDVLYFDPEYAMSQTIHCRVTVKEESTGTEKDYYAELTVCPDRSETVTATIGTWSPGNVKELTLNSPAAAVGKPTWYKFVPEETGWYKVQADLTEEVDSTWCELYTEYNEYITSDDWVENEGRFGNVYYLEAGVPYYITEYDANGGLFEVYIEKYNYMPETTD